MSVEKSGSNVEKFANQEVPLQTIFNRVDELPGGFGYSESSRTENHQGGIKDIEFKSPENPGTNYRHSKRGSRVTMDAIYYENNEVIGGEHLKTYH